MDSHCGQRRASKSATEISVRRERSRAMCRQGEGRALREAQRAARMQGAQAYRQGALPSRGLSQRHAAARGAQRLQATYQHMLDTLESALKVQKLSLQKKKRALWQ